jgi:glycosyltransferase involved in cell wall biosynthesis
MNTGGPAVFLDHLTKSMADLGTKSIIAYGYCESNETDYTDTHKLNADLIRVKSLHRSLSPISDIRSFFQLRKIIKTQKPDVVNTHTSKAGALGRLAARSAGKKIPVVHTFHGHLIYGYFPKYKIFVLTLIEKNLARFTDAFACITKETQDSLKNLGIGPNLSWRVIRLGIPVNSRPSLLEKHSKKTTLLWVGRFTSIKDPGYAISVIKELEFKSPGQFELVMIGGGEQLERWKSLSTNLPVEFHGWINNPFDNIEYFDLLILTSKNEGMGLVMLEAANHNRATVARAVGGIGEFLLDGVNGCLINGDAKEMARAISSLSYDQIQLMGKKSKEILEKDFNSIRLAADYYKLYDSLIVS